MKRSLKRRFTYEYVSKEEIKLMIKLFEHEKENHSSSLFWVCAIEDLGTIN